MESYVNLPNISGGGTEPAVQRKHITNDASTSREVSIATGLLAYPTIRELADRLTELYPALTIYVYPIRNDFFGESITVTGLLTGKDILKQLSGKKLGEGLFLSETLAREDGKLLDDVTLTDIETALQVPVDIVKSNGMDFIEKLTGEKFCE